MRSSYSVALRLLSFIRPLDALMQLQSISALFMPTVAVMVRRTGTVELLPQYASQKGVHPSGSMHLVQTLAIIAEQQQADVLPDVVAVGHYARCVHLIADAAVYKTRAQVYIYDFRIRHNAALCRGSKICRLRPCGNKVRHKLFSVLIVCYFFSHIIPSFLSRTSMLNSAVDVADDYVFVFYHTP